MEAAAASDPLTGVLNRRGFERSASKRLSESPDDATGALLFIDLNEFKAINDSHGHEVGDQILVIAAKRLQRSLRSCDIIGRPGGDEFVALVPDVTPDVAETLARRLAESLEKAYNIGAETHDCAASIGMALYPTNANTLTGLLREADQAMYRAKARSRGTVNIRSEDPARKSHVIFPPPDRSIGAISIIASGRRLFMRNTLAARLTPRSLIPGLVAGTLFLSLMCSLALQESFADTHIAPDAESISPLGVGDKAPTVTLQDVNGEAWTFDADALERPALIISFRGGWCPYCNLHLSELRTVVPQINELGVDVLFFSGDRPEILYSSLMAETQEDIEGLDYTIYSDATSTAAIAFGTAFTVEGEFSEWQEWAEEKGRDVNGSSIENNHSLAVPYVYAVDRDGVIQFAFVEADYKVRLPADDVLAVATELTQ